MATSHLLPCLLRRYLRIAAHVRRHLVRRYCRPSDLVFHRLNSFLVCSSSRPTAAARALINVCLSPLSWCSTLRWRQGLFRKVILFEYAALIALKPLLQVRPIGAIVVHQLGVLVEFPRFAHTALAAPSTMPMTTAKSMAIRTPDNVNPSRLAGLTDGMWSISYTGLRLLILAGLIPIRRLALSVWTYLRLFPSSGDPFMAAAFAL